jgi:hypothetical protein
MNYNTDQIVQHIFQANSLEEISLKQLRELVEEYPSFNFAHYLLSKKLEVTQSSALENEIHKTALYFTNPFWLRWLLQETEKRTEVAEKKEDLLKMEQDPPITKLPDIEPEAEAETKPEPVANEKQETLLFEPYHTIDYFASQGIKVSQEEHPNDKFGRQLKSFTEWLKTMKKLPRQAIEIETDSAEDVVIEDIASHSIEEKEVVTETMAEVLVKQGRNERAIELYHKLSLLNPTKNAYFAAKIEQLK